MLRTKQTHSYTHYKFIQLPYTTNTPSRNPHQRFQFINSKYPSPFFLNLTYCIKDTNMQGIIRNYDPIRQMYIFCPMTRIFNVDETRPLIVPHEYIQPVEIKYLLIFDGSCDEISNSKQFVKVATAGRHRGLNTIYKKHILLHQSKL